VPAAGRWRTGDPSERSTRLGPLVDERAVNGVLVQLQDAVQKGARLLCGGARVPGPGSFLDAAVLAGCTDEMVVWTEETFGPVAGLR
jgi:succinate-semialdehyde dehydrogenase/glutarate-semialdehyde dehydrogenase